MRNSLRIFAMNLYASLVLKGLILRVVLDLLDILFSAMIFSAQCFLFSAQCHDFQCSVLSFQCSVLSFQCSVLC